MSLRDGTAATAGDSPPPAPPSPPLETHRLRVRGVVQRVLVADSARAGAPGGAGWPAGGAGGGGAGSRTGWPVFLLHGIGGSADDWRGVLPVLAAGRRVVAPDAPGHGFSEKPPVREGHRYDVGYYTDATLGLMDAYGITRADVVAASGGGPVALAIALAHPQRVRRLVLVGAAGLGREVAWSYRLAALPGMQRLAAYFLGAGRLDRRRMEAFGRAMCYDPTRLPADWAAQRQAIWATPGAVEAFYATARAGLSLAGQRVDFSARLSEVRQPTLLVWGRQDATIPVAHALAAAQALPDARLHVFERCGHMPMWEYPGAFAETVLAFLG